MISDDEWEAYARHPEEEVYLSDQERALLRLLDAERAEFKRLRVQLGCVKALATLWEETAERMETAAHMSSPRNPVRETLLSRAHANRSHAAALRETLSEE